MDCLLVILIISIWLKCPWTLLNKNSIVSGSPKLILQQRLPALWVPYQEFWFSTRARGFYSLPPCYTNKRVSYPYQIQCSSPVPSYGFRYVQKAPSIYCGLYRHKQILYETCGPATAVFSLLQAYLLRCCFLVSCHFMSELIVADQERIVNSTSRPYIPGFFTPTKQLYPSIWDI